MSDDDESDESESKALDALPDSVKDIENLDIEANSDRSDFEEEEVEQLEANSGRSDSEEEEQLSDDED